MRKKSILTIMILICLIVGIITPTINANGISYSEETFPLEEINKLIEELKKKGEAPGLSVTLVKGSETLYQKNLGYADRNSGVKVNNDTIFELGSTSKAFTALAVLQLQANGKIDLDESVSTYLPWFNMNYKGMHKGDEISGKVEMKIRHLVYHTSGIPFQTIAKIPASDSEEALEETVRTLIGENLDHYPGETFSYATINYDILGLLIQEITGMTFESYVKNNVLEPLDLNHTYLLRDEINGSVSLGYKLGFTQPREFSAPVYRGNTPAGYVMTTATDISRWLKIQLGSLEVNEQFSDLIEQAHIPDRTVAPSGRDTFYSAGWEVDPQDNGIYSHGGENPNFSSYLSFIPELGLGVAVLANINTEITSEIGKGILDIMQGEKPSNFGKGKYKNFDIIASYITFLALMLILVILGMIVQVIIDFVKNKRKISRFTRKNRLQLFVAVCFIGVTGVCLYIVPYVLFNKLSWSFLIVWAPFSLLPAVITVYTTTILFTIYYLVVTIWPKQGASNRVKEKRGIDYRNYS